MYHVRNLLCQFSRFSKMPGEKHSPGHECFRCGCGQHGGNSLSLCPPMPLGGVNISLTIPELAWRNASILEIAFQYTSSNDSCKQRSCLLKLRIPHSSLDLPAVMTYDELWMLHKRRRRKVARSSFSLPTK